MGPTHYSIAAASYSEIIIRKIKSSSIYKLETKNPKKFHFQFRTINSRLYIQIYKHEQPQILSKGVVGQPMLDILKTPILASRTGNSWRWRTLSTAQQNGQGLRRHSHRPRTPGGRPHFWLAARAAAAARRSTR